MKNKTFMLKFLVGLGMVLLLWLLDDNMCLFKRFIGVPCPGCGMTRSYLGLIHLNLKDAWHYHPLFWLPPLLAVVLGFRRHPRIAPLYRSDTFWLVILALLVGVWLARMVLFFPHTSPMDYNPTALLPSLLKRIGFFK